MRGAEFAGGALAGADQAAQRALPRHDDACCQPAVFQIRLQLHHRHRRQRRQIMRVDHLQQVLGEHRVLRVQLELHARGQKREAFQQPLDIGVGAFERVQAKPAGDLGILARKLRAHVAHVLQLAGVVRQ